MLDWFKKITKYGHILLSLGIVGILVVLLFPVPKFLLDVLLAFSISVSIVILMTTLFIIRPLDLSVFPTLLLVTTIIRLALNIASTRLILSQGHTGTNAAGKIIESFGHFVMQGNVVIGIIVFMILTIINFIVITKGSGRIAEVAARFSLDAMPGKQMAVDADLSAGIIDEVTAKARRKVLEEENAFFGAMDGANKFVRGDAIAGLIITFINLVGGIIIGVLQRGLSFDLAVQTYTMLTIGDGLVTQIPSLIISLSAGLLVTKSGVVGSTDQVIFGQLSQNHHSLWMSSLVTGLIAFLPGLPFFPFFMLSASLGGFGYIVQQIKGAHVLPQTISSKTEDGALRTQKMQEDTAELLKMDLIRIELGYGLLGLMDPSASLKLIDQIKLLRQQFIKDYGFVLPSVRIQDNLELADNVYIIKIKEIEASRGELFIDELMLIGANGDNIEGRDTIEPAFGLSAKWITANQADLLDSDKYTIVRPVIVLITHLTEIIKEYFDELLPYAEVQRLLDDIEEEHKKLVKDLVPEIVNIGVLQKILQNLLSEFVSIRDLPVILGAIAEAAKSTKSYTLMTEAVRLKLARQISVSNTHSDGILHAISLSGEWESVFMRSVIGDKEEKELAMAPSKVQEFVVKLKQTYDEYAKQGLTPILITSAISRPYVKTIISRLRSSIAPYHVVVMSQNEVYQKSKVKIHGVL